MADTVDRAAFSSAADEAARRNDARPPSDEHDGQSIVELVERLGRELGELGVSEARLETARNAPAVQRTARDLAGTLVLVIAALTQRSCSPTWR